MTDLERVREIVQENCVLDSEHGDLTADGYEADRIIDAHEKEDEERKAEQRRVVMSLYDELAEWKQVLNERSAELADLKAQAVRVTDGYKAELAKLREAVRKAYNDPCVDLCGHGLGLRQLVEEKE